MKELTENEIKDAIHALVMSDTIPKVFYSYPSHVEAIIRKAIQEKTLKEITI
jgi:hypothetical protein